jgi:large subunit ribosomal protein L29
MKYSDLTKLTDEELVHQELRLERKLLESQFRLKTGQLEDTASVGFVRKDIARIRTTQRGREATAGLGKNALRDRYRGSFDPKAAAASGTPVASTGGFLKGLADRLGIGASEEAPEQE